MPDKMGRAPLLKIDLKNSITVSTRHRDTMNGIKQEVNLQLAAISNVR